MPLIWIGQHFLVSMWSKPMSSHSIWRGWIYLWALSSANKPNEAFSASHWDVTLAPFLFINCNIYELSLCPKTPNVTCNNYECHHQTLNLQIHSNKLTEAISNIVFDFWTDSWGGLLMTVCSSHWIFQGERIDCSVYIGNAHGGQFQCIRTRERIGKSGIRVMLLNMLKNPIN